MRERGRESERACKDKDWEKEDGWNYVCVCVWMDGCVRAYVRTCMGGCVYIAKVVRMNPFAELKWKRAYCQNNI